LEALKSGNDVKISHFNEYRLDTFVPYSLRSDQLYILKDLVHVRDERKIQLVDDPKKLQVENWTVIGNKKNEKKI